MSTSDIGGYTLTGRVYTYVHQWHTVYPKKYAHGFVVLCFVVVVQSFIMNSHEVFIHIHQGCFAGTGAIVRLAQCQWSKPDGYGKISQCITTTKHSKAVTVCIFLGIYCRRVYTYWDLERIRLRYSRSQAPVPPKSISGIHFTKRWEINWNQDMNKLPLRLFYVGCN